MSIFSIFNKKNDVPFPFHLLKVDMHSHLIPGIDDGAQTEKDSFQLIQGLLDLGYEKLITSPHVMQDLYKNTPEIINNGLNVVQQKFGVNTIQAAAEYYLDEYISELFTKRQPLLAISNNLLLVELGFVAAPLNLENLITEIQYQGYQPVIAHPERYAYFHQHPEEWQRLKEKGCLLQCNLLSFSGYYGVAACKAAEQLAERRLVDLLGTDMHHHRHLQHLRELNLTNALAKILELGVLNPQL